MCKRGTYKLRDSRARETEAEKRQPQTGVQTQNKVEDGWLQRSVATVQERRIG